MANQQVTTQQVVSLMYSAAYTAMTVSILGQVVSAAIGAMGIKALTPGQKLTERAIDDMRFTFGVGVVDEAVAKVGTANLLALGAEIEKLYIQKMKETYGEKETELALSKAPPGDLRTALEIAKALKEGYVTPTSPPEKVEAAVETGKRRGRQVAQPVKDTKTGTVYRSKASAGMAVAAEYGLDSTNSFVWYEVIARDPTRFVRV